MSETTPGRWRKKPVVVEARQLTRDNGSELDAVHGGEFRVQFVAVVTVGNREPLAFLGVSLQRASTASQAWPLPTFYCRPGMS